MSMAKVAELRTVRDLIKVLLEFDLDLPVRVRLGDDPRAGLLVQTVEVGHVYNYRGKVVIIR